MNCCYSVLQEYPSFKHAHSNLTVAANQYANCMFGTDHKFTPSATMLASSVVQDGRTKGALHDDVMLKYLRDSANHCPD
jgi:hypothetical protein